MNNLAISRSFTDGARLTHTNLNNVISDVNGVSTLLGNAIVDIVGDNRVLEDSGRDTELEVTASGAPDLYVHVNIGVACVSGTVVQVTTSTAKIISTPVTNNRYTIVQISNLGVISTVNSAEAGSPTEPSASADNIKLAAIYLRTGTTEIYDTDQGSEGYIIDRRTFSSGSKQLPFFLPGTMLTTGGPNADGYYIGAVASGFTFPDDVTINKAFIQAQVAPVGADLIFTLHNITAVTSDTITLTDGSANGEDATVDLDVDAGDELAIQCTQVGSTTEGEWVNIELQYKLR